MSDKLSNSIQETLKIAQRVTGGSQTASHSASTQNPSPDESTSWQNKEQSGSGGSQPASEAHAQSSQSNLLDSSSFSIISEIPAIATPGDQGGSQPALGTEASSSTPSGELATRISETINK